MTKKELEARITALEAEIALLRVLVAQRSTYIPVYPHIPYVPYTPYKPYWDQPIIWGSGTYKTINSAEVCS
ncbi:hypothetical protein MINTM005_13700 [Mycobacterium intracellulare]|uniref:hypothetical protein n=1 Tax=Mycobacterium intracellulare TaxID=1767 RepID=UPI001925E37E|nr:hypothetical protein [Mycobacterium intracellulare]BCO56126.1 hypothetical protein MINTM005_13700 [Mycobacterium intracellulare]